MMYIGVRMCFLCECGMYKCMSVSVDTVCIKFSVYPVLLPDALIILTAFSRNSC